MHILFFDTETTGLPSNGPNKMDTCRLLQISYIVCSSENMEKILIEKDYVIKADGWTIPNAEFHGVSMERSQQEGQDLLKVVEEIKTDFLNADVVLAHNAAFDKSVIQSELSRNNHELLSTMNWDKFVCTMKLTKYIVKAKNKLGKLKNPTLNELYEHTFWTTMDHAHNSLYDTRNLHTVMAELVRRRKVSLAKLVMDTNK
jgi:DNA polymerase III epsilon subunit-like protein